MAAPFLKWAGGKRSLAAHIVSRAPREFGTYHEPFLGGGAVFFRMRSEGWKQHAALSDANGDLIRCYEAVRDETERLLAALETLAAKHLALAPAARREHYYAVRASVPEDPAAQAARLIFLNRTGYNGLYRLNRKGAFNVPYGRYANPRIVDKTGISAAAAALCGTTLRAATFEEACGCTASGDFVYLDPPYVPLSATSSFTQYTGARFGPDEQEALRDCIEWMTHKGVAVLLSNSYHEAVRTLYGGRGYAAEVVSMSRAINSAGAKRQPIPELLIDNFDRPEVKQRFPGLKDEASSRRRL